MTFRKVLVANRGEIARRIMRTCRAMGLETVAVCSEADLRALHVREADEAVVIGAAPSVDSYLRLDRIIDAALRTGAQAIHPGYGFLSENEAFARAVGQAGLVFVGPTPEAIAAMGSKIAAKRLMAASGVPVVPGYDGGDDAHGQGDDAFMAAAEQVGFPLLVKASAGGGGKGMRVVRRLEDLPAALATARREAKAAFGDDRLLVERYIQNPRHIEVQILGDAAGNVVHLFERECSIQRRHQKILEEAPSPMVDAAMRARIGETAALAGRVIGYRSAGTVEFVAEPSRDGTRPDAQGGAFYFLEVNARLQVEHPVTELVTGLDLVRLQLEVAMGRPLPFTQGELTLRGHAIEARLYAEDADKDFLPQTGALADFHIPSSDGLRVDSGVQTGDEVGIHYDPMLAKVIAWGADRAEANRRLARALGASSVQGVTTNLPFLRRVLAHPAWEAGEITTHFIADHAESLRPHPADKVRAARLATLQRVLALDAAREGAAGVLPGLPLGWRNNRYADPELRWESGGETLTVAYRVLGEGRILTRCAGVEVEVQRLASEPIEPSGAAGVAVTGLVVRLGDAILRPRLVARGDVLWVHLPGEDVALAAVPTFVSAEKVRDPGSCRAPMPGKVIAVRVAVGDVVTVNQPLVVLEAMKMEHALDAPADGTIAEVLVQPGDIVQADQELVRLIPA